MTAKEAFEYENGDIDMRSLHPLWEEYVFPSECNTENKHFYFNPYNGIYKKVNKYMYYKD